MHPLPRDGVRVAAARQEVDGASAQLGNLGQDEFAPIELRADRDEPTMRVGQALGKGDKRLHVAPRASRHEEEMPREGAGGGWPRHQVTMLLKRCGRGTHGHLTRHHRRAHGRRVAQSILDEQLERRLREEIGEGEQRSAKLKTQERSFGDDAHEHAMGRESVSTIHDGEGERGPRPLAGVVA